MQKDDKCSRSVCSDLGASIPWMFRTSFRRCSLSLLVLQRVTKWEAAQHPPGVTHSGQTSKNSADRSQPDTLHVTLLVFFSVCWALIDPVPTQRVRNG